MVKGILWYYHDERFEPGTVAEIGEAFRLELVKTNRKNTTNYWRLYLSVRTHNKHGVKDGLKRGVCVAQFNGSLTLDEVHEEVYKYMDFFLTEQITNLEIEL